jgi:hypothetical protein
MHEPVCTAKLEYGGNFFEINNFFHSVEDERSGNPYNCAFSMRVESDGFAGEAVGCECDYKDIKDLAKELRELAGFKTREVVFKELAYDSEIRFTGDGLGHITVSGTLYGDMALQSLKFSFETDQTVYPAFICSLERL